MLAPYALLKQFYSVGMLICLIYALFSISFLKNDILVPKSLLLFFLSFLGIYTINLFRNGEQSFGMINFIIGAVLTFFYIGSMIKYFEFERFYKTYKILCILVRVRVAFRTPRGCGRSKWDGGGCFLVVYNPAKSAQRTLFAGRVWIFPTHRVCIFFSIFFFFFPSHSKF